MIRIKNYIFNENDIKVIENDEDLLTIIFKDGSYRETQGTFEDIEWNYGTPQETQRQMQKELCKSCYYRDTISNKLKELEEKNKTFEDYNKDLNNQLDKLEERIDKAIEYIEKHKQLSPFADLRKEEGQKYNLECSANDLLDILKGYERK